MFLISPWMVPCSDSTETGHLTSLLLDLRFSLRASKFYPSRFEVVSLPLARGRDRTQVSCQGVFKCAAKVFKMLGGPSLRFQVTLIVDLPPICHPIHWKRIIYNYISICQLLYLRNPKFFSFMLMRGKLSGSIWTGGLIIEHFRWINEKWQM